jgi:hypothetical protein
VALKVIDSAEQDFHMQNKLLGHPDGIKILPVANLSQHIRYTRSA